MRNIYSHNAPVNLEMGGSLSMVEIAYTTYGKLNSENDNVAWICHALTANDEAEIWWNGLVGPGCFLDPDKYFIVCANIIGSCYGTTGPRSINPETGNPYGLDFPAFTMKDTVHFHELLATHLGISSILILVGGSCGGSQALEMSLSPAFNVENLLLIASSVRETEWIIAIHESQRMALQADSSFTDNNDDSGQEGLKAARAIGILSYRTELAFHETQRNEDDRLDDFKVSSYMNHQGQKLVDRFHAHNYWLLTKCLDTHNLGRNRDGVKNALKKINAKTTIIGIDSDKLIPVNEQKFIAKHIPDCTYHEISSTFGHDGFLKETSKISEIFSNSINNKENTQINTHD